jgi:alpha-D-xyloside xylohydrolase
LPKGADWIDFWTGEKYAGGQTISKEVPLDILPLFVRAGSILPMGPKVQYAEEKKWDNLEIRVYEGANGEFTLYEDESDNYNYEKGMSSTIKFIWNDAKKELTIAPRQGSFPGMLAQRKFNVVRIGQDIAAATKTIDYTGAKVTIKL